LNKKLDKFLASDKRPEGTMTLPEVYGFLFTVCCSPEPVDTAEWIGVVFNGEDPCYKSYKKKQKIEAALLEVFTEVEAQVQADEPQLPGWIEVLQPPVANFGDEALLAFWADGFFDGVDWLEDVWNSSLDEEGKQVWDTAVKTLAYFSHRQRARVLCDELGDALISKQHLAETRLAGLATALATYARMGRTLAQSYANTRPHVREVKLGRNDPCFCGSGKKYKKCCIGL